MDKQAAEILLGNAGRGDGFTLRHLGFKWHLRIKPLTTEKLIRISGEVCQIRQLDSEQVIFTEELNKASDLTYIAKAIAIATNARFPGLAYRAIIKLDLDNLAKLWSAVLTNSNPAVFFSIMGSARGLNKIRTTPVK